MGFLDDAKNLAAEHADKVESALDKAEQFASEKTGGKFDDQIQKATGAIKDHLPGGSDSSPEAGA